MFYRKLLTARDVISRTLNILHSGAREKTKLACARGLLQFYSETFQECRIYPIYITPTQDTCEQVLEQIMYLEELKRDIEIIIEEY